MTKPLLDPEATWIDVGRVGRPHGTVGHVRIQLFNPDTDLFPRVRQLRAWQPGRPAQALTLLDMRPVPGAFLVHFEGIDDRDAAARLTHAVLSVDSRELPVPAEEEFYLHEALGAEVFEAETGERMGVITNLVATNTDLLEITLDAGGKALIPVASESVESLGREKGRVVVRHLEDWRSE